MVHEAGTVFSLLSRGRKDRHVSQKELGKGICSAQQVSKIEKGEAQPDFLLTEFLLQRLGMDPGKFEVVLSLKEYEEIEARDDILDFLRTGKLEEAERKLETFCRDAGPDQPVRRMNRVRLLGILALERKEYEAAERRLGEAIRLTLGQAEQFDPKEGLLSGMELENLILYAQTLRAGQKMLRAKELLQKVWDYVRGRVTDGAERARLQAKVAVALGNVYRETGERAACENLCEEALERLRDNDAVLCMPSLFGLLLEGYRESGQREKAERIGRWKEALEQVYAHFGLEVSAIDKLYFNPCTSQYYLIGEIIREERKALGMSQEELAEGIYQEPTTLSRVENGQMPDRKKLGLLMERLGMGGRRYAGAVVTEEYAVLERDVETERLLCRREEEKAALQLKRMKKSLDLSVPENRQRVGQLEIGTRLREKKLSAKQARAKAEELLRLTYREGTERVPFQKELRLMNRECLCLRQMGREDEAISAYQKILERFEKSRVHPRYHFLSEGLVLDNVTLYMTQAGRVEEAEEWSRESARRQLLNGERDWERTLLETYDVTTGQASLTELDGARFGVDGGRVVGMYVTEPGKYVFRIRDGEGQVDRIVHSDLGDQNRAVDLMPACLEKGGAGQLGQECMCDAEGNVYSRDDLHQELYVLDGEGRLLLEYGGGDVHIEDPLRMPSGELLFPVYDRETGTFQLAWFDPEQKKLQTVSRFETNSEPVLYGIQGSDVYYREGEGIVRWNVTSGARTLVYRFSQDQRRFRTMLVLRDGGVPVLRMYGSVDGQEEDWLVTLSEEEPELKDAIRVADLVRSRSMNYDIKNLVATVSRKYRNAQFVYETYDNSGAEDYRTRILAELAAGGGPDVLFVSLQDMRLLQGQGYLTDLRSVLPEASLNRILPAVVRMGTAGDTFAGLAPAMTAYSAMTLKEFWDRDTWTLEDVLDLMDTGQFTGVMCQWTMPFAPQAVVKFLTEFGLWDASLVDWETGKCHFDGDLFVRLLQTAKTYQLNPFGQETGLGAGGCLMDFGGLSLDNFNQLYDRYGEGYRVIGFPSVGNYLNCEGVLVVNRKVSDEKAVSAFFEHLLSDKVQDFSDCSILKVSPEDLEYREVGGEKKAYWKKQEVRIKEDGTTTLEDYAAFLEGCNPPPALADSDLIQSIVWEEAEAFIVGDKSAEDVGKIIQRRIQVYLDENR